MKFLIVLAALCAVALGLKVPRLNGRIVGGDLVSISEYPHQVSVRIYDQHICGGSIIDENTILTAAHCVHDMDTSEYSISAGHSYHEFGTKITVSEVIENENYLPEETDNDMAILKLDRPLTFGSTIQSIVLEKGEVEPGTQAFVSGWGVTSEGSQDVPEALRAVSVEVISDNDCSRQYGPGQITEHMMCAQTPGHDSCQGDSGGPLVANSKLIGVVSWGYGCARPEYPGVYAKVSNMIGWINANK